MGVGSVGCRFLVGFRGISRKGSSSVTDLFCTDWRGVVGGDDGVADLLIVSVRYTGLRWNGTGSVCGAAVAVIGMTGVVLVLLLVMATD